MSKEISQFSEDELYHLIGSTLLRSLPEDWQSVQLKFEIIDEDVFERSALVDTGGGEAKSISLRPSGYEMYDAFTELATRMEEAGHGKWQSAQFNMARTGKFDINFTYPK